MSPSLLIILPCFNEEDVINDSSIKVINILNMMKKDNLISLESKLLFVDDGSNDDTWNLISKIKNGNSSIKGLKLSRNYGHQNAILSGLLENVNYFDLFITIDADLQDDLNVIPKMIELYKKGNEIVYGVRKSREVDSYFKRKSANYFYKLQKMLGINIVENHADFRLISKKVLKELSKFKEVNLFLRAIFPIIGYKNDIVYYDRKIRSAGETKYPLSKMIKFAADGITSFSIKPLRLIFFLGLITFIFSLLITIWILFGSIFTENTIPGWASTTLPIYFLGGIQLLSLGVIGEYIGKIYFETKSRPRYTIEEEI